MSDQPRRLGGPSNYWLYHPSTGYDLTRSLTPRLTIPTTTTQPITICPSTTALIIVDMQNFFLDPAAGRPRNPLAVDAERKLIDVGIPACQEGGVRVVHLTWGLEEGEEVLPTVVRGFGAVLDGALEGVDGEKMVERFGERATVGEEIGDVKLEDGRVVPGGKLLVRDQWNTALHQPFEDSFSASQSLSLPQVRFHKSGISGFGSPSAPIATFLEDQGIKTLLFTGVNTDQCVMGSLQDAVGMGFDAVLMKDGCATASPDYARKMAEFNCRKNWGFVASLDDLADGVRSMNKGK